MSDGGATPPAPKTEHSEDLLDSFSESSPEPDDTTFTQETTQVQKRKGGRKPIYATSEERKQRNRQAQAAFRERRTEYIKQLEMQIKQHEEALLSAQKSHHRAADECLMLRYKNSLLERILVEKGIDVQAELAQRGDFQNLPISNPSSAAPQPSPVHSAIMNRYSQTRRSAPGQILRPHGNQPLAPASAQRQSPRLQPTPPSQTLSPTAMAKPTAGLVQGGNHSPGSELQAQRHQQPRLQPRPQFSQATSSLMPQPAGPGSQSSPGDMGSGGGSDQEYADEPPSILDDDPGDQAIGPGPFPHQFSQASHAPILQQPRAGLQGQPIQPMPPMQHMVQTSSPQPMDPGHPAYARMPQPSFNSFEPELDADPFGLSASMHFPTQYTYHESTMRK